MPKYILTVKAEGEYEFDLPDDPQELGNKVNNNDIFLADIIDNNLKDLPDGWDLESVEIHAEEGYKFVGSWDY